MAKVEEFRKTWGDRTQGYTEREARERMAKIDEAYGTGKPDAMWHPAKMLPDTTKKSGYYISITRKE